MKETNGWTDVKLMRKLEAQEIARQAAQIKLMKKLEKQAMVQAEKEAKKQRALIAAEERRKKREQMKILKQQEKMQRIQQNRLEKELRTQQILQMKRQRKEEAANAKIIEAEKRNKEKELRRLQAEVLRHQDVQRHRLDLVWERERRRQHLMLIKAVEARKKAEEKERLKKEKKDEKRLNKERKLELRRLELEKLKELKKPQEDMCLSDHTPLPQVSSIPGLLLSSSTFSDLLVLLQFLRSFGKVLGLDPDSLDLGDLQEGLLNLDQKTEKLQDLLVCMVAAALRDPGIPAGHRTKTALGDHVTNVVLTRDNVSEVLQIYMEAQCGGTELDSMVQSLRTRPFQAHHPSLKAAVLTFLVNELCCSKAVISEIDKHIDHMTNLRKDKWVVEGKLRKLRNIHAKKTGKKDGGIGGGGGVVGEDGHALITSSSRNITKRKEGDSEEEEEEEEEEEDSEEQGDEEEEEEEENKKGRKSEICEEEENNENSASVEELEKLMEKTYKQQSQIRQKLFDSSHSLRSMMIGQDRYRRRYWILPQCGGLFIEGVGEGCDEEENDKSSVQLIKVKEETSEEAEPAAASSQSESSLNLFLQKPGSFSKLSKLLETSDTPQAPPTSPSPVQVSCHDKTVAPDDQTSRIQMDRSSQWFSVLPRSPCDESSIASGSAPNPPQNPAPPEGSAPLAAINNLQLPELQPVKSFPQSRLKSCDPSVSLFPGSFLASRPAAADEVETLERPGDKPPRIQDHAGPQPIPQEMLRGWWRLSDVEEVHGLLKCLHSRGVRERVLQKQLQKHLEFLVPVVSSSRDAIDAAVLQRQEVNEETLESWSEEEQTMEVDIGLLQQVEELERKVVSAGLQVKGWMHPEPQSHREDLVYHRHGSCRIHQDPSEPVLRVPDSPLDIAVSRLAELQRNIHRSSEEEASPGLRSWFRAVRDVRSSAQLSLCIQQLNKSVCWEKGIIKAHCQLCQKGDDEEFLLLCDSCDEGYHTYCHKPTITTVPEGDWFCPTCVAKDSGQSLCSRKQQNRAAGGKKEVKRSSKTAAAAGDFIEEEAVSSSSVSISNISSSSVVPKKGSKELKKRKEENSCSSQTRTSSLKRTKTTKEDGPNELETCRLLLEELESHQDAWPFLTPVDLRVVPGYRRIIKRPMDFSTIRDKLSSNQYFSSETFVVDVNLVFDNCEKFNEDDSAIGEAGHNMRRFFDKRWTELLQ